MIGLLQVAGKMIIVRVSLFHYFAKPLRTICLIGVLSDYPNQAHEDWSLIYYDVCNMYATGILDKISNCYLDDPQSLPI